ncbi:MAG: hypothetical protein Q9162_004498 [Coniocarpon cinnabarinum]
MSQDRVSPFTLAAVSAMRKLYPETLVDKSFDNAGLLLEATINMTRTSPLKHKVLLTIDLTTAVADEAIESRASLIVAYHPIIFKPLKSITTADPQQRSLLRLAAEGISVYTPHTAVDAADGGNADWLMNMLAGRLQKSEGQALRASEPSRHDRATTDPSLRDRYTSQDFPKLRMNSSALSFQGPAGTRKSILPAPSPPENHPNAGMGRVLRFASRQPLALVLDNLLANFLHPPGLKIALPYPGDSPKISEIGIDAIAVCAGSGGSVFRELKEHVDVLVTGEMGHHEVLAATEKGQTVICVQHSNSERGYLAMVLSRSLQESLRNKYDDAEVVVSEADRDPFGLLTWRSD